MTENGEDVALTSCFTVCVVPLVEVSSQQTEETVEEEEVEFLAV